MAYMAAMWGSVVPAHARSLAEIRKTKEIRIRMPLAFAETLGKDVKPKVIRVEFDEQFFNKEGVVVREASYTPELLASGTCDFHATDLSRTSWRLNKKEDKDLQAAVQNFFDTQRAVKDSTLNKNWKNTDGITLIEFITLVTSIK